MEVKHLDAMELMLLEYERATKKFGRFASAHEGYAVMQEEMDELWEAVKDKQCGTPELLVEAVQVGAMAVRFLVDICGAGETLNVKIGE